MADKDRDVVIHPSKKFWSQIEAIFEASGDFIDQMCM
jgi:virulence-associated protein VagC